MAAATKRRSSSSSGVRAPAAVGRLQTHKNRTEQNRRGEGRGTPPGASWKKGERSTKSPYQKLIEFTRAVRRRCLPSAAAQAPARPASSGAQLAMDAKRRGGPRPSMGVRPPVAQRYAFGLPSPRRSRCHSLCETSSERDGVRVLARSPPKISALRTERQTQTQTPRRGERRSQEVNCQQY